MSRIHELIAMQWLVLPLAVLGAWLGGYLFGRLTHVLLGRLAARTTASWDDRLIEKTRRPLTLVWMLALLYVALPWLSLAPELQTTVLRWLHALLLLAFFWAAWGGLDVGAHVLATRQWAQERPASRSLILLGRRLAKVAVLVAGLVTMLSEMGYPVASLLAGLGIGGLAVALAARSTLENLFGAFSLGVDQPIRVGDFVKVEDFVGTVEAIGLRSTRIRTLDRTLISLPNGKLADMRLESFTARDRMRLACTVGLVYGTTAAQMRTVLAGLEQVLRNHPKIWPDAVVVRFKELASSSLDIEVMAWFATPDWGEFQRIRQEVLLQFMAVVERSGTSFAFPTQTVHLAREERLP
jgi:MscS family membrane protein